MDKLDVTVGGLALSLGLNFGAAREISQKVGDILAITREAALEAQFAAINLVHKPAWMPTIENVPLILWIGTKHGGDTPPKLEEVQDAVFRHGFLEAREVALQYVAAMATPHARENIDATPGGQKPGE